MAGLKKDVELIFRGTDRASPTISGVRKEVSGLSAAIAEQIKAAERGEGTVDALAKAYKQLQGAQGSVTEITKLATAYDKLVKAHADQALKAQEATAKEQALSAQIAGAEAPSKRLTNAREAAGRAAAGAAAKEEALAAQVRAAGAAFEQAGGDVKNFAASQEAIRAAALQTAQALNQAGAAMDGFKAAQDRGSAVKATAAVDTQFNAMAAGSGLPQAQIAFISTLENKVQELTAAMRANEASAAAMNQEIASRATQDAQQRVRAFAAALDEADASAQRLQAATAFKSQAAGIEAAARDVTQFGVQASTGAQNATRLAEAIQGIIAPTDAASRSLSGIGAIVDAAEASLTGGKRRLSEYNAEVNNLAAANAGLMSIARDIDGFRAQEAAVQSATGAFRAAQAEVLKLAEDIRLAANPTQEMATALTQAEAKMQSLGSAMQNENAKLVQLQGSLTKAGVDTRNLAAAEIQLEGAAKRAAAAQGALSAKTGGKGSFLGLNPNEMQNLGFQVNDIVVGLASGQKPLTVLVQQGAQIGQIFPGAFSAIARFIPVIALVTAVLAPLIGAMNRVAEEGDRIDHATQNLASMGQVAAGLDVTKLAAVSKAMEDIGVSAEDANKIVREFMTDGLNAGQMEQYVSAAQAASKVTGEDFPTSVETLRTAFQGGYEDIVALDAATGVYSDTELAMIQTLYEHGQADEARATALEIFNNRMNETASQSEGPWTRSINNLAAAWRNFTTWLGDSTAFSNARQNIDDVARAANYLTAILAGKSHKEAVMEANGYGAPKPRQVQLADPNRKTSGGQKAIRDGQNAVADAKAVTAAQKKQRAEQKALNSAMAQGATDKEAQTAANLAGSAFQAGEDARQAKKGAAAGKSAARRAAAEAKRRANAAKSAARDIENTEERLQKGIDGIDAAAAKKQTDSLEERLGAIDSQYAKLFRDIDEYATKTRGKGLIGGKTIAEAREHVKLQEQTLKNYATLEFREKQIGDLEKERTEKLAEIADLVDKGVLSPEDGLLQSNAVIDQMAAQMSAIAQNALDFAIAMRTATPNPALEAFIAKMQGQLTANSGGSNTRAKNDVATGLIERQQGSLSKIISERDALIEHENMLVAAGLETFADGQKHIQGFYNSTNGMIQEQIGHILNLAAAFKNGTPEQQLFYKSLEANLANVQQAAQGTNESFVNLKSKITDILASNIVSFIDTVAQAFANMATGSGGVLDFLDAIARAFLTMIANILQAVATLIIEALILDAVDKATGGILKPLLQLTAAATNVRHDGGMAGGGGRTRDVSPLAFAGAPRYHTGGIAGFAPDEVAAVLKVNEEVLTRDDPRHRLNGGLNSQAPGGPSGLRQVLAIGDDEISKAMSGAAGEQTVLTHIRRNRASVKMMLDN